jgi:mRNA interferase MazF
MTSKIKKNKLPTHVLISEILPAKTVVLLEQIRTIDKTRLIKYVATLNYGVMKQINRALCTSIYN